MNLKGLGVAMVTPFKEDGSIDFQAIPGIVENIITGRVDYIVVLGTTAEVSCLTDSEKKAIVKAVIESNQNKVPLVIGIGGNNTVKVAEEIQATDLSPFQAILSISPYYNKPTQEGIYQHYGQLSKISSLPIIVYNVPSRTGSNIAPETFLRMAEDFENIIAIKEASGDMRQAQQILKGCPSHIQVISGDDALTLPMLLAGAVGTISVLANALPVPLVRMFHYIDTGDLQKAYSLHFQLLDIVNLLFEEGNPVGVKALMESMALCGKTVRLPLIEASFDLHQRLESAIKTNIYKV
ncbi:MAG: 4-hydroxy-tetrahydrodipicolinate synthase [Flavobacteriaceae bacterium]|jgi:4-hydroxy-tetrahydrodipicolinate synthase|tara:strand:- start:1015 stop:1899 length:885 start_codon:yes stop_codon:yes gene_type:complete